MDSRLRRDLDAIARDRSSGASELALRACTALQFWLRRHPRPATEELAEVAEVLFHAQPAMSPLLRLANQFFAAADSEWNAASLNRQLAALRETIQFGPDEIARRFKKSLRSGCRHAVCTYSYSSTVLKAILAAKKHILWVACSESRPGLEGRKMAEELASAGIHVRFFTDAALPSYMRFCSVFLTGADAISDSGFLNKIGAGVLVDAALRNRKPVWILADTSKFGFLAIADAILNGTRYGTHSQEVWPAPPVAVTIFNHYFESVPFRKGLRVLCEHGWRSPAQIARDVKGMQFSPRLRKMFSEWITKQD